MSELQGLSLVIDKSDPFVADAAVGPAGTHYLPANAPTQVLVQCLEAVRDLRTAFGLLDILPEPWADRRLLKTIATPLYSLAKAIDHLHGALQERESGKVDRKARRARVKRREAFEKSVPFGQGSGLKTLRDKLAAHVDKDAVYDDRIWATAELPTLSRAICICLNELNSLLAEDEYAWTLPSDDDSCRLMACDGSLVHFTLQDGRPGDLIGITLTKSPREAVRREMDALYAALSRVVARGQRDSKPSSER